MNSEQLSDLDQDLNENLSKIRQNIEDLRRKSSLAVAKVTERATKEVESKILSVLRSPCFHDVDKGRLIGAYENILKANTTKLERDLRVTKEAIDAVVADAKEAMGKILVEVRDAARKDHREAQRLGGASRRFFTEHFDVFVSPAKRPEEEIEAERLLQQCVEDQLLQWKQDFERVSQDVARQVRELKAHVAETLGGLVQVQADNLVEKVADDFERVNESVAGEVVQNKLKIKRKVDYFGELLFGKEIWGSGSDEEVT
ncbi:uncharacterized protein LOC132699739 [Cylas formicarius]|uniref:uncharacterized protein LOC132699739 n=1 Tax=Cylas formicarius TaxID=197179 RepID=UPI00295831D3|nr:uncharacterized protein LOC132699739 [Cylas formicarius]